MNRIDKKAFLKHSKIYLLAEFFNKGLLLLSLPIFTYLLSPEDYGKISVFLTTTNILIIVLGLNLYSSIIRRYHEPDAGFPDYAGTVILILIVSVVFSLIMYSSVSNSIESWFSIDNDIFRYSVFSAVFLVFINVYLSSLQTSQQSKAYTKILVSKNILITILTVLLVLAFEESKYLGKIYADIFVLAILGLFVVSKLLKICNFSIKLEHFKYAFKVSLPLIPHTLAGLILLQADILMINKYVGNSETGLYSFGYNIGMAVVMVFTAFNNSWSPIFYKSYEEKDYKFIENSIKRNFKLICFVGLLLILFSKYIVLLMSKQSYHESHEIVPLITFGFIFAYLNSLYFMYAMHRKKLLLVSFCTIFVSVLNIYFNYKFLPVYGYVAAAYTTLFSYILLSMFYAFVVINVLKEKVFQLHSVIYLVIFLGIIVILNYLLHDYIENVYSHILFIIGIVSLYLVVFMKKEIRNYFA